jgi:uncharacterized protein YbjT (DUF2867 family)
MYIITGASGHTGHRVATQLLQAGKSVRAIVRNAEKVQDLKDLGAEIAVGDLEDEAFLAQAFQGATAVYAMIPPKWNITDWRSWQDEIGKTIANALGKAGVKKAVILSSLGAHLPNGAGPVSGLYDLEKHVQAIAGLDVLAFRPAYFMSNLYAQVDMIKGMGILGSALRGDLPAPMIHTNDIGDAVTKRLLTLDWSGFEVADLGGAREYTMTEVASIIGKAIGKPALPYVQFSYEDSLNGMLGAGLPETIAKGYNEMYACMNDGHFLNAYHRTPENTTPTTLETFVEQELAHAFN